MQKKEHVVVTTKIIPPDGGWGWIIVLSSFFCNYIVDGTLFTFGIFLQDIGHSFGVHQTEVALANSFMTGFYTVTAPITSLFINLFGFRIIAFVGGIVAAAAFFVSTVVPSIYVFILTFGVIGGIGFGMIYLPAIVVVGCYFERWRSLAVSVAVTGSAVGIMSFPIIVTELLGKESWQTKFYFIAGGSLLTCVLALTYRPIKPVRVLMKDDKIVEILNDLHPDYPATSTSHPTKDLQENPKMIVAASLLTLHGLDEKFSYYQSEENKKKSKLVDLFNFKLLKSRAFVLLLLSSFVSFLGFFIPFTFTTQRASEAGISDRISHYLYTALGLSNAIGRLSSGACSSIPKSSPLLVSCIHLTICGITTIAFYFFTDVYSQFLHIAIYGITCACIASIRAPIVAEMVGVENLSSAYALVLVFSGIAGFIAIPIAGGIIKITNSFNASFLYAGCVITVSAIMLYPIQKIINWEKTKQG